MLKKACVILLAFSGYAFANNSENSTAYKEPKYKISDIDMKILIRQLNNIEQCIYPDLAKPDYKKIYEKWGLTENITMQYFEQQLLNELLGEKNYKIMKEDENSMRYFNELHSQLNHQNANVDKELCNAFKPKYQSTYQRIQNAIQKNTTQ